MREVYYTYGGDEYILAMVSEEMSSEANLKVHTICRLIREENITGVTEVCPVNASFLVRYKPELINPDILINKLKETEKKVQYVDSFSSKLVEIPVLYNDPWSIECAREFSNHHQDPSMTNIEFVARINGLSVEDLIKRHSATQFIVSTIFFMPGGALYYQMVDEKEAILCPKYKKPRGWTPIRTLVHGGCFTGIMTHRSPGGYQLIGSSAVPIFEPEGILIDLKNKLLVESGDRVKFRSVEIDEYNEIRKKAEEGTYRYKISDQEFKTSEYQRDPNGYLKSLERDLPHA